jgi:very-short-patch-repair endonuclease
LTYNNKNQRDFYYGARPHLFDKAKELRLNMTKAEEVLWEKLRKKQIDGNIFRRQHPIDRFIADFYCHNAKLVIEVDGEIHENQKEYDIGRTEELNDLGLQVIRFTNEEVLNNIELVIKKIRIELNHIT